MSAAAQAVSRRPPPRLVEVRPTFIWMLSTVTAPVAGAACAVFYAARIDQLALTEWSATAYATFVGMLALGGLANWRLATSTRLLAVGGSLLVRSSFLIESYSSLDQLTAITGKCSVGGALRYVTLLRGRDEIMRIDTLKWRPGDLFNLLELISQNHPCVHLGPAIQVLLQARPGRTMA